MAQSSSHHLNLGIARLLRDPKFADLTIICEGRRFNVHRAIVCSMSPVLAKVCEENLKDGTKCQIDHAAFDADTVERLVQWMYTGDYAINTATHAKASYENEDELSTMTAPSSSSQGPSTFGKRRSPSVPRNKGLIVHALMYGIADFYEMPNLKAVATDKFAAGTERAENLDFVDVIRTVYTYTDSEGDELRKHLHNTVLRRPDHFINNKQLSAAMVEDDDLKGFVAYLLREMVKVNAERESEIKSLLISLAGEEEALRKKENALTDRYTKEKAALLQETALLRTALATEIASRPETAQSVAKVLIQKHPYCRTCNNKLKGSCVPSNKGKGWMIKCVHCNTRHFSEG